MGLEDCILNRCDNFGMYSKNNHVIYDFHGDRSCIIDFYKTQQTLKKRAKCEFITGEAVDITTGRSGVSVIDSSEHQYGAKIFIDCSGNSFVACNALGISKPKVMYHCVSQILTGCTIPDKHVHEMSLYFDFDICNSASWAYPIDNHTCQVGIGEMEPYKIISGNELKDTVHKVRGAWPFKGWFDRAKVHEDYFLFGHNPVIQPLKEMQADRIMLVGDAAGMSTPLVGDGIRTSLIGGRNAALVAKEAVTANNFSKEFLAKHEKMWWDRYGKYYIWTIIMRHLICNYFENKDWNEVVERLKKSVDYEEFWNIISSKMTFGRLVNLFDFKITADMTKEAVEKHLPHLDIFNRRHNTSTFI